MENQHEKIAGYRDLAAEEIEYVNHAKQHGELLGTFIAGLECVPSIDKRWLAIAKTTTF
jgi:hypothetical protein